MIKLDTVCCNLLITVSVKQRIIMKKILIKEITSCRQCSYTTSNVELRKCKVFGHVITKAVKDDTISDKCKLEDVNYHDTIKA